jgi:WD repeat-containing protein 59
VKKRTCTLGLNGPWGESSSVFVRVSFTFPMTYPHGSRPDGTPTADLERSPLISIRNRAFILRRLRMLRETRRPCLEACLRFLLYGNEDEKQRRTAHIVYDSSSDEETTPVLCSKRETIVVPLHSDKNIAEPVTSQCVFGPNGMVSQHISGDCQ